MEISLDVKDQEKIRDFNERLISQDPRYQELAVEIANLVSSKMYVEDARKRINERSRGGDYVYKS